jgi:hypothetical protein
MNIPNTDFIFVGADADGSGAVNVGDIQVTANIIFLICL